MKQFTERQTIMISKKQAESLQILKTYDVNVSQFIRAAISEKIKAEWKSIKETKTKGYCPF